MLLNQVDQIINRRGIYTTESAEDYPLDELKNLFDILTQPEEPKSESC